ncbi:hypothetical protein acdb102_14060 [Acidothermaceae bacterium B102]|nr:hypothetical protein acdb102_14060 [Acidothermaceae bacterium B102]
MLRLTRARAAVIAPPVALLALALPPMVRQPLWYDEVATQEASRRSLSGLWHLLHHTDGVLAGYYLLLHLVLHLGSAPWLLRLPSLAATLATVVLVGRIGGHLLGDRGVYAALLFAANPFVVGYAYDARPYALATLGVTGAAAVVIVPTARSGLRWSLWASLAVVSHLFAALALVSQLGALSRRGRSWSAVPGCLLVVLGLVSLSQRSQLGWISRPAWYAPLSGWSTLSGGWWLALPALLGLVAALRRSGSWRVVGLWAVAPLALLLLVSAVDPVYLPRYAIEATPAMALVTVTGLEALAVRWQRLVVVPAMAVGVGVLVVASQGLHSFRYENLPAAADFIRDGSQQGDGLVYLGVSARLALSDEISEPAGSRSDDGPQPPDVLLASHSDAVRLGSLQAASVGPYDVPSLLGETRRVWVVSWAGVDAIPSTDPTSEKAQATLALGWTDLRQHSFGSMRVTLWGRPARAALPSGRAAPADNARR